MNTPPLVLWATVITPVGPPPLNLVGNPSVEAGAASPDQWFHSASGATWAAGVAHSGGRSLRLAVAWSTADWRATAFPVQAGQGVRVGGFFQGAGSAQCFLTVRWWADAGASQFVGEENVALGGPYAAWTRVAAALSVPAGALAGDLLFRCPAPTTADIYGDDFFVTPVGGG